ncbi:hypothetical protein CYY_005295 [Polysphondylium violaceum]|uniref:Right handed beta helix domain-containing protein n=1 Tax=Polysphondylium violaceum TaxID=133409 RepID=A0A8J4V4B6_9MYCE|nr:hypothetical protein CYY_005295 [Polysphondylium violaceum]
MISSIYTFLVALVLLNHSCVRVCGDSSSGSAGSGVDFYVDVHSTYQNDTLCGASAETACTSIFAAYSSFLKSGGGADLNIGIASGVYIVDTDEGIDIHNGIRVTIKPFPSSLMDTGTGVSISSVDAINSLFTISSNSSLGVFGITFQDMGNIVSSSSSSSTDEPISTTVAFNNCTFTNNTNIISTSAAMITLRNCTFVNNNNNQDIQSTLINTLESIVVIDNCVFGHNGGDQILLLSNHSHTTISNSLFDANTASQSLIQIYGLNFTFINSVFQHNSSPSPILISKRTLNSFHTPANATIISSQFISNFDIIYQSPFLVISSDLYIVSSLFRNNIGGKSGVLDGIDSNIVIYQSQFINNYGGYGFSQLGTSLTIRDSSFKNSNWMFTLKSLLSIQDTFTIITNSNFTIDNYVLIDCINSSITLTGLNNFYYSSNDKHIDSPFNCSGVCNIANHESNQYQCPNPPPSPHPITLSPYSSSNSESLTTTSNNNNSNYNPRPTKVIDLLIILLIICCVLLTIVIIIFITCMIKVCRENRNYKKLEEQENLIQQQYMHTSDTE